MLSERAALQMEPNDGDSSIGKRKMSGEWRVKCPLGNRRARPTFYSATMR